MILTAHEINSEIKNNRIIIEPYNEENLEPNSYGFHLAPRIIYYENDVVDAKQKLKENHFIIPEEGCCLEPGRFYLGSTMEKMGSDFYVSTLYARRSVSTMGMWIQFSAPLGHTGAIIPWTLEITVTHPIIVYPNMLIGKIAFWKTQGSCSKYNGKYIGSKEVVSSRILFEMNKDS